MGRSVKNPKKHILCCRVNDHEMDDIKLLAEEHDTSISELLRHSLLQLTEQNHQNANRAA